MVYYSALHYAAKAAKSAEAAADSATQASQVSGKIIQVGFDGTLANGVLTFKHAPGGVEVPYDLQDDFEYELDLAFSNTATLPTNTEMAIKNGNDTIRFVSALHREATTNATVADMDAVMRYNSSTGYRWLFKAAYKVTPSGAKVFLLYPVVYKEDTSKITNCITEIPQDIKLEINNGTLTLKAGSTLYEPSGAGNFIKHTTTQDYTWAYGTGQYIILPQKSGNIGQTTLLAKAYSGATAPTNPTSGDVWYDTTNNVIKRYGTSWVAANFCLPIAIVTSANGSVTSIDQVFNGFGYIGSTVFALPGVKGLIPNGRNADGSLRNIEFTVRKVITKTENWGVEPYVLNITADSSAEYMGFVRAQDYYVQDNQPNNPDTSWGKWFSPKENIVYQDQDSSKWTPIKTMFCGTMSINSNRSIAGIDTKLPFKAVDQNDFNKLDEEVTTLDEEVTTLDAQNVKLTGNQTIGGTKTFTATAYHTNDTIDSAPIASKDTGADTTKTPTGGTRRRAFRVIDVNGKILGDFRTERTTDGRQISSINARNGISGSEVNGVISVSVDASGSVYTYAPTPASTRNDTTIATTAWVTSNGTKNSFKPNWAGKVSITRGADYTAPSNGFIVFYASDWNKNTSIKINSTELFKFYGNVISGTMGCIPVCKGDVVNITGGGTGSNDIYCPTYFVPFK